MVTHYFHPHIGGLERIAFEQAKRLSTLGHEVTVLSSRLRGTSEEEVKAGIKICRINALNFLYDYFGIPFPLPSPTLLPVLQRKIKEADICIIHGFGFLTSLAAAWLSVREKTPYILYQHNPRITYRNHLLNWLQRCNELIFGVYVINHASRVLAVSNYVSEYVVGLVPCNVTVLYGAVDPEKFYSNGSRKLLREELTLPPDKLIVLTVRRLVSKNSVDILLTVASQCHGNPDIFFVVVGDGPEYTRLENFCKTHLKNCKFVGQISDELLQKYYQASSVFILPSIEEGLAIVLLEAMSSRIPIIVASPGGQVEVLEKEKNGLLVTDPSPDQFAQAIRRFLHAPMLIEMMGNSGREIVLEKFAWEKHMQAFTEIIQDLRSS
jgi:glycosyltransferase involved in cell wall biosynthesis